MKKRIATIITCLLICVVMLAGCNIVSLDMGRYLNAVVVGLTYETGDKVNITKEELLTAYNSYGANLVQSNGYTVKDAINQTLEVLINRKVILEEAKKLEKSGEITFSNADKNELYDSTLEALKNNLDEFIKEVKEKWNINDPAFGDGEADDVGTVYKPYEPKAELAVVNGKLVIKVIEQDKNKIEELRYDLDTDEGKAALLENYNFVANDNRVSKMGQTEYIKQLKKNEEGRHLSTDDASVFDREIERIYKNLKENMYIEKYETLTKDGTGISSISVNQLLNRYKSMMLKSYAKYTASPDSYKTDILESYDNVNYVIDDDYFFVSHILIKFTDAQAAEYKALTTDLEGGAITPLYFKERVDALYDQVRAKERDAEGKLVDSSKSCKDVLLELQTALANASGDIEKAEIFNEFIYKYNEDDGIMNAEYNYVVGVEESKMVESFNEASRKLHDAGVVGAISDGVISDYGVHIVFYAGECSNVFDILDPASFTLEEEDVYKLVNTRLNLCSNKTVFDKVYEDMVSDNYSIFQNMNLNFLKEKYKIVYYEDNYKDLY